MEDFQVQMQRSPTLLHNAVLSAQLSYMMVS